MTQQIKDAEEARLAVRKKLYEDFPFYAEHALKIRTKKGTIEPFVLNNAQHILQEAVNRSLEQTGRIRIIILKARQQGLSTHVGGYLYFKTSQSKAAKALVVAHKAESTQALFDLTRRYHDNCPEALKPSTKYSSRKELSFDRLDSSYTVATAGGDGIARGETINYLHASELAFWPSGSAQENWNGLIQSVPEVQGTAVFIESTANGVTGVFYNLWKGAVEGTNGFLPVFIPWFMDQGYRESPPDNFERTPEEQELAGRFDLDDEQLFWRRRKIAQNGLDLFKQEYPATPDEAFLTSGRPVFHSEKLSSRIQETPDIVKRLALEGEEWNDHVRGELVLYQEIDPGERYWIGVDVAGGAGANNAVAYRDGLSAGSNTADFSCAQVLNSKKEQVAVWHGHIHPDYFGKVLYRLGVLFNWAFIGIENNNHGILPNYILANEFNYPHIYQDSTVGTVDDKETIRLGFTTTVKTKPMILDQLRGDIRDEKITLNDKLTLREMLTFVVKENGKMEADEGCHDDTVMALAIANHIHDGDSQIVPVLDSYYHEAV